MGLVKGIPSVPWFKSSTISTILALIVHFQWPTRQLDVSNAFFHGTLDEETFMEQPQALLIADFISMSCKLHKSIYALNQALRAWFNKLASTLLNLGFIKFKVEYSFFLFHESNVHLYL